MDILLLNIVSALSPVYLLSWFIWRRFHFVTWYGISWRDDQWLTNSKNVEGCVCILLLINLSAFACRDWRKSRDTSVRMTAIRPCLRTWDLWNLRQHCLRPIRGLRWYSSRDTAFIFTERTKVKLHAEWLDICVLIFWIGIKILNSAGINLYFLKKWQFALSAS